MGTKIFLALALGLSMSACGDDFSSDAQQVCDPGKTESCACPGGSVGAQRCADDGSKWEQCACAVGIAVGDGGAGGAASDALADAPDAPILVKPSCIGSCYGNCYGMCRGSCAIMSTDGMCAGACTGTCTGACSGSCAQ